MSSEDERQSQSNEPVESSDNIDKSAAPHKLPTYIHRIVTYLQDEFLGGRHKQYSYKSLIKACKLVDLDPSELSYLKNVALASNPLINVEVKESLKGGHRRYFSYKPPYDITSKTSLLRILKQRFYYGQGALAVEDLEKSVPNALDLIKGLGKLVLITARSGDKKHFLFYNDPDVMYDEDMSPELLERLRNVYQSIRLDSYDDRRINKFLMENKIHRDGVDLPQKTDEELLASKKKKEKRKRSSGSRQRIFNTHVAHLLEDYKNGVPVKRAKTDEKRRHK
ncbi:hypothetical protein ACOME3_006352 [Neoechinorhynchus agilis]